MAYVGQGIKNGTFSVLDTSGNTYNGSNVTFSLGTQVGSPAQLLVSHDGVIQKPGTDYTLATGGTQITFTTAPASGASIFIVEISGAVGGPINGDLDGAELVLDTDGDTSITADTDDQIDIKIAGNDDFKLTAKTLSIGGAAAADTAIVYDGNAKDFYIGLDDSADKLVIGEGSTVGTNAILTLTDDTVTIGDASAVDTKIVFDGNAQDFYIGLDDSGDELQIGKGSTLGAGRELSFGSSGPVFNEDSDTHDFRIETDDNTHAFFIHGAADRISIGQDGTSNTSHGFIFPGLSGSATFIVATDTVLNLNREDNGSGQNFDGTLVNFLTQDSAQGSISVSGSTVSYNAFSGSHWSRLADNSQPTILRGTVMESIATMCDWYRVKFTIPEIKNSDGEITQQKDEHAYAEKPLPEGKSVGDTVKHTHAGVEYDAVIEKQLNEQLPMTKISDTEDSKAVYGVFNSWDNEPDDGVNDMLVTGLGAFIIRVHKDETLAIGDLLSSKGDGTAKKQADDILRASTIAKVTSTTKIETYSDGSYCVPCTLHCG
jgi:hypothetical protein